MDRAALIEKQGDMRAALIETQGDMEGDICCAISGMSLPTWVKKVGSSGAIEKKFTCYVNMSKCPCGLTQSGKTASNKTSRTTIASVVAEVYRKTLEHAGPGHHETGGELLRAALAKLDPGHAAPPPPAAVTATKAKRPRDDDDGDADARRIEALEAELAMLKRSTAAVEGHKKRRETKSAAEFGFAGKVDITSDCGRRRASRAVKETLNTLKVMTYDNAKGTSSVFLAVHVLQKLVEHTDLDFDDEHIYGLLPVDRRRRIETDKYIVDRAVEKMTILKRCRTEQEREHYHVAWTVLAPQVAKFGDQTGMGHRVAARFGVRREGFTVFRKSMDRAAEIEKAEALEGEIKPGEKVVTRCGTGTLRSRAPNDGPVTVEPRGAGTLRPRAPNDGPVAVELAHGEVTFTSAGKKKGGARLRRFPVSFAPPRRQTRSDATSADVRSDVEACIARHCPHSPCAKHRLSRVRGPRQREYAQMLCRYVTWTTLWKKFKEEYPASAGKIEFSIFRCLAPWNLRKGGSESCLCQSCENAEGYSAGRQATAAILGEILDAEEDDDAADDEQPPPPPPLLEELVHVLEQPSKMAMLLLLTCRPSDSPVPSPAPAHAADANDGADDETRAVGPRPPRGREPARRGEGRGAPRGGGRGAPRRRHGLPAAAACGKLEDRGTPCASSTCPNCGFARLWSCGVRRSLEDGEGNIRSDVDEPWRRRVTWKRIINVPVPATNSTGVADENEEARVGKKKELTHELREGTVVDFLDEFEGVVVKHLEHRSTLAREKETSLVFDRCRRPGLAARDMDYGENYTIEEARQVQSEHWCSKQCTIFMSVWSWIKVLEWDKSTGDLDVGAEVVVDGELAGAERVEGSFWARVISRNGSSYVVEDAAGVAHADVDRARLRHRVLYTKSFVGVTGDRKHDSYSMRYFVKREFEALTSDDTFERERITKIATHSDNAAQHFKSVKSLSWYTTASTTTPGRHRPHA